MGKASRTKVDSSRREKIAAQRAAERRTQQRQRILIVSGAILAVIAIVVVIIVVKPGSNSGSKASTNGPTGSALASVVSGVTGVPAATLDKIGDGGGAVTAKPAAISGGTALTANGKPEMLYMGAEYCPYCAAERWPMIVALSRFGTFSGLTTTHSASVNGAGSTEPYPNTPTWTFHGSTYTSKYLTFTPVEMETNVPNKSNGGYTNLEVPTKDQQALLNKYDVPPYVPAGSNGAIPFIDFGNKYLIAGASYNPQVLSGLSWAQIATDLKNPDSGVAKGIGGTANYITAAICKMTGDQPASACTAAIKSLEASL
jgi:hypothetical protein